MLESAGLALRRSGGREATPWTEATRTGRGGAMNAEIDDLRALAQTAGEAAVRRRTERLAINNWRSHARSVLHSAFFMTDAETIWFFASIYRATRKNPEDALRLRDLRAAVFKRWCEEKD